MAYDPLNYGPNRSQNPFQDFAAGASRMDQNAGFQSDPANAMIGRGILGFGGQMQGAMGQIAATNAGNQAAVGNARMAQVPLEITKMNNANRLSVLDRLSPLLMGIFGGGRFGQGGSMSASGPNGFVSNFGQMALPTAGQSPKDLFDTILAARQANAFPVTQPM